MKKFIIFLLFSTLGMITLTSVKDNAKVVKIESGFDKGWEDGYCEGWKDVKGQFAICPIAPISPIPPIGCSNDNYKCGYNMGFKAGYKAASK